MNEHLFPVQKDGKAGFINLKGEVVIDFSFENTSTFSEGLARVFYGDKVGFIDLNGNLTIPPIYDSALEFSEGLAVVTLGEQQGYIDTKGNMVIAPQYYQADDFKNGLALVQNSITSPRVFIDKTGMVVLKGFDFLISDFREGLINCGLVNDLWGFINAEGNIVIEPRYKLAQPFYEGKAAVSPKKDIVGKLNRKGKYGFINHSGDMILPPVYEGADIHFSENYCAIWDKGYGYINTKGDIVIPCEFDYADHFSEDLAVFKPKGRNKGYGFIDKSGHVIIQPTFTVAEKFEHGLASVTIGKEFENYKYGYVNKSGDYVWEPAR